MIGSPIGDPGWLPGGLLPNLCERLILGSARGHHRPCVSVAVGRTAVGPELGGPLYSSVMCWYSLFECGGVFKCEVFCSS